MGLHIVQGLWPWLEVWDRGSGGGGAGLMVKVCGVWIGVRAIEGECSMAHLITCMLLQ